MAENRLTQVAVEALAGPGVANARLSQIAVETLVGPGAANARLTQVAVETLVASGGVPAAELRETQAVLEHADFPLADVRETQAGLEVVHETPPSAAVKETQAVLEHIGFPPNGIWESQACLEVIGPVAGIAVGALRNYAYTGIWAHTPPGTITVTGGNWSGMTQVCLEIVIPAADWPV